MEHRSTFKPSLTQAKFPTLLGARAADWSSQVESGTTHLQPFDKAVLVDAMQFVLPALAQ